jgi:hypothetical protein
MIVEDAPTLELTTPDAVDSFESAADRAVEVSVDVAVPVEEREPLVSVTEVAMDSVTLTVDVAEPEVVSLELPVSVTLATLVPVLVNDPLELDPLELKVVTKAELVLVVMA